MNEKVLAHFAEQGAFSTLFGSPFTGQLIERMGKDLEEGGPVAALTAREATGGQVTRPA